MSVYSPDSQRAAGLAAANRTRQVRSAHRHEMHAMTRSEACRYAADLIAETPKELSKLTVPTVLDWIPRLQYFAITQILEGADVSESRRLMDLTDRQRRVIGDLLRQRA